MRWMKLRDTRMGSFCILFCFCLVHLKRIMGGSVIHFGVPSAWDHYSQSWDTCVVTARSNAVGLLLTMASILAIQDNDLFHGPVFSTTSDMS